LKNAYKLAKRVVRNVAKEAGQSAHPTPSAHLTAPLAAMPASGSTPSLELDGIGAATKAWCPCHHAYSATRTSVSDADPPRFSSGSYFQYLAERFSC